MADIYQQKDLKQIFIYVSSSTAQLDAVVGDNEKTLKELIVDKSLDKNYNDRIFFIAATNEIITHGNVFGASKEITDKVNRLQKDITKLVGVDYSADGLENVSEIVDDKTTSLIAKFVHAHMSSVSNADGSIIVTPSAAGEEGIDYDVKVDTEAIIDKDSIISKDGKLSTNVELILDHRTQGDKADVPFLTLRTKDNHTVISDFDVTEFVTDGMIDSVVYDEATGDIKFTWNADGHHNETVIPVSKIFNIEGIHSINEYITIAKNIPGVDHDGAGTTETGICWDVTANVSDVDLTKAVNVTFTDETTVNGTTTPATFTKNVDADASHHDTLATIKDSELADAKKVATKFSSVEDEIVATGNKLLEKLAGLKASLDAEIADRETADDALQAQITANTDDITILKGDATVEGSVEYKIAENLKKLTAQFEESDPSKLVTITLEQENGLVNKLAVDAKVNTLGDTQEGAHQGDTPDFVTTIGDNTIKYYTKSLANVAATDPSLVTTQDAWLYGQAIFGKTVKAIQDDTNQYIHIKYVAGDNGEIGHPQIEFDPWAEVTDKASLDAITNYENQ